MNTDCRIQFLVRYDHNKRYTNQNVLTSSQSFFSDRLHPYHSASRHLRAAVLPAIAGPTVAVAAALAASAAPMADDVASAAAELKEELVPLPLPEIDADSESAWDGHWRREEKAPER